LLRHASHALARAGIGKAGRVTSNHAVLSLSFSPNSDVRLPRGNETPALDGFERGVIEAARAAARLEFDLVGGALRIDQHAQHDFALLAHVA
jgi:hypothetical protein